MITTFNLKKYVYKTFLKADRRLTNNKAQTNQKNILIEVFSYSNVKFSYKNFSEIVKNNSKILSELFQNFNKIKSFNVIINGEKKIYELNNVIICTIHIYKLCVIKIKKHYFYNYAEYCLTTTNYKYINYFDSNNYKFTLKKMKKSVLNYRVIEESLIVESNGKKEKKKKKISLKAVENLSVSKTFMTEKLTSLIFRKYEFFWSLKERISNKETIIINYLVAILKQNCENFNLCEREETIYQTVLMKFSITMRDGTSLSLGIFERFHDEEDYKNIKIKLAEKLDQIFLTDYYDVYFRLHRFEKYELMFLIGFSYKIEEGKTRLNFELPKLPEHYVTVDIKDEKLLDEYVSEVPGEKPYEPMEFIY